MAPSNVKSAHPPAETALEPTELRPDRFRLDIRQIRIRELVRRHWAFSCLLAIGVALRIVVLIAYSPAILFPDSLDYLGRAINLLPGAWHPLGYPLFLRALHVVPNITVVSTVQHMLVVVDGLLLYLLLLRFHLKPWLAALGTAPLLLDAFQLDIEQYVLSEAFFETLIAAALVTLLWAARPSWGRVAISGLFLAAAAVTRFDGIILAVPAVAYLLLRRTGWKAILSLLLATSIPVLAYAAWYDSANGQFELSDLSGVFLYGRVVSFVDCSGLKLPPYEQPLCPSPPPSKRQPVNWYVSSPQSPARTLTAHDGKRPNSILINFDLRVIEHQPLTYARATAADYLRQFLPQHHDPPHESEPESFFQLGYPNASVTQVGDPATQIHNLFGGPAPSSSRTLDRFLIGYQNVVYAWGPLLAILIVLGLIGAYGAGESRRNEFRPECFVLVASGILLFLFAVATSQFGFRYQLPTLVAIPPAGVLALSMLVPARFRDDADPG